jgi:hypothetical protein
MLNLSSYPYTTNETFLDYVFESSGPKGVIKKVARFKAIHPTTYNFGFGDLNESTGEINDTVVSNNEDGDKVLSTLANIIHNFIIVYPNAKVLIRGTTPSRTRLYQMGINKYCEQIQSALNIWGQRNGKWEPFKRGENYDAFLGER